jgi:type I restriction enzyme R subunit
LYISGNQPWFADMDPQAATRAQGVGTPVRYAGGTDALETPALWEVPEIRLAGGLDALRALGRPTLDVMREAKGRLLLGYEANIAVAHSADYRARFTG